MEAFDNLLMIFEIIFQYFAPTKYIWYFYCASVTFALMFIKLLNYGLHNMYDTTECIQEEVEDWQESKRFVQISNSVTSLKVQ